MLFRIDRARAPSFERCTVCWQSGSTDGGKSLSRIKSLLVTSISMRASKSTLFARHIFRLQLLRATIYVLFVYQILFSFFFVRSANVWVELGR